MTLVLALLLAVSPEDDLRSKDAFLRAQALYKDGRYLDAIHTFEESGRLKQRPAVSYNLARCYDELAETGRALFHYREYLRQSPNASDKGQVETRIAALSKKLASKKLQVLAIAATPEEASLLVDGQRVGVGHVELEVSYGRHELKISAPGYESAERVLQVAAEAPASAVFQLSRVEAPVQTVTVPVPVLEPEKARPADAPVKQAEVALTPEVTSPPKPPGDRPFVSKHLGSLIAGGVAVVAAGVGAGFGISSASATADLRAASHSRTDADALVNTAVGSATGANVSYGVAGAAAVTAVVLFFIENAEGTK